MTRFSKIHPALKHAAYSATTLLPGEDLAAFEKLHRALVTEFSPKGASEEDIVAEMAHLTWRKQNLATFRIVELAKARRGQILDAKAPTPGLVDLVGYGMGPGERQEAYRAADEQARQELGDIHKLIDIGEPTTIEGLMKELDVRERLDGMIDKCLKRLLFVRGLKSISSPAAPPATQQRIAGPKKTA